MPSELSISNATTSNLQTVHSDIVVDSAIQSTPGITYNIEWDKWVGYYKSIPELQAVIDKVALWTVGKGFKTDDKTKERLSKIRGAGKDTFDDILENAVRVRRICGDFFAEIIKNKRGEIVNLKPLNPQSMQIYSN